MDNLKRVVVGSKNPIKIKAVEDAVYSYFTDIKVESVEANSQISVMPLSKSESRLGAKNRAHDALIQTNAWLGVGNEGGMCQIGKHWYLFSTTYITDGIVGSWGTETLIQLPHYISQEVISTNEELGTVIDRYVGSENIKQKEGGIGIFTQNEITRKQVFKMATIMALVPWTYNDNV